MYKCPECGTEYSVVPDVCVSCGHIPEEDAQIDLFAKARHQEQKNAELQQEYRQQCEARRAEKEANKPVMSGREDASETPEASDAPDTPETPDTAERISLPPEPKPVSPKALKAAAICGAAAVALGGAAYFGPQIGKPAGFEKSDIGTFYMKENALWFQNGHTGKKLCLNPDLQITEMPMTEYEDLIDEGAILSEDYFSSLDSTPWVNRMLYVSPDGKEFYYPKELSLEDGTCTLMHCTADHPEQAEEITDIRFRELQYDSVSEERSFHANTYMQTNPPKLNMNPSYLVYKDALYYRDLDGQFCCLRNGQTEVIAPVVERYWTMPEQEGVFYITVADYDAFKEQYGINNSFGAFVPDFSCMMQDIPVILTDEGATFEMHSDYYAFYRTEPGEEPKRLVPEGIEDWKPFSAANPYYLYYTVALPDEGTTELRRYNFRTEKATTITSMNDEGRFMLIQDYPDGSCYYAFCRMTGMRNVNNVDIGEIRQGLQDLVDENGTDMLNNMNLVLDEDGNITQFTIRYSSPADMTDVYYQGKTGEPAKIMSMKDAYFNLYYETSNACPAQPYIWLENWDGTGVHSRNVFYRDQELTITIDKEANIYSPLETFAFSEDGTQIFAYVTDYVYTNTQLYGTPRKTLVGELHEAEPVEMKLAGETKDEASFVTLPLAGQPAEVVRVTPDGMFTGDKKIASNVYNGCFRYQPEYRQLCFIANEKKAAEASADENVIPMNKSYCGTLMRRSDKKTAVIAESVTDFIPADREHFAVICGEPGEAGVFNICTPTGYYAADNDVTKLCGIREIPDAKSTLESFFDGGEGEIESETE